jgi:hypothetical protein
MVVAELADATVAVTLDDCAIGTEHTAVGPRISSPDRGLHFSQMLGGAASFEKA